MTQSTAPFLEYPNLPFRWFLLHLGKYYCFQLSASLYCLGVVMATDDDVLFIGVVGISKRREARGRFFASLSFSSSTEILLRSTMFSKSLSGEMNSELSEEERRGKALILQPNVNTVDCLKIAWKTGDNRRPLKTSCRRWSTNFRTKNVPIQLMTWMKGEKPFLGAILQLLNHARLKYETAKKRTWHSKINIVILSWC